VGRKWGAGGAQVGRRWGASGTEVLYEILDVEVK
jgi:hypothetical protein